MYDTLELVEKIKKGADGDVLAAVDACKVIVTEKIFTLVPAQSHAVSSRPDDKGFKMKAARSSICKVCSKNIEVGEVIYFKKFHGASHATCVNPEFLDEVKKMTDSDLGPPPF